MYPIHKKLLPFQNNGIACNDVNDVLLQQNFSIGEAVLDLGCGVGNTIITVAREKQIHGFGISISAAEIAAATRNAARNGLQENCHFFNQSFDDAFAFHFDKAIAVESLKHSFNLGVTARNLFTHCRSGGSIYIIDDFYSGGHEHADKENQLIKNWALKHLYSREDFVSAFVDAGFTLKSSADFSAYIIPKSKIFLQLKISLFSLLAKIYKEPIRKNLLRVFKAGFILEYLFQQKKFSYELLIFSKPPMP